MFILCRVHTGMCDQVSLCCGLCFEVTDSVCLDRSEGSGGEGVVCMCPPH